MYSLSLFYEKAWYSQLREQTVEDAEIFIRGESTRTLLGVHIAAKIVIQPNGRRGLALFKSLHLLFRLLPRRCRCQCHHPRPISKLMQSRRHRNLWEVRVSSRTTYSSVGSASRNPAGDGVSRSTIHSRKSASSVCSGISRASRLSITRTAETWLPARRRHRGDFEDDYRNLL